MGREHVPVDRRLPRQHAGDDVEAPACRVGIGEQLALELGRGEEQAVGRHRRERVSGCLDAEPRRQFTPDPQRGVGRDDAIRRPALGDGAPEQALGPGHGQQRADAHRASRFAEDRDVGGVAAERGDVLADPRERRDLVLQAEVRVAVGQVEEALGAHPVVDRDANDPVTGESAAVVRRPGPDLEHPARDPDHDRQAVRRRIRRPDIEVEAVLARLGRVPDHRGRRMIGRWAQLRWLCAERQGIPDAIPRLDRPRGPEPVRAERGCRERDAQEAVHPFPELAPQPAVLRRDDRRVHSRVSLWRWVRSRETGRAPVGRHRTGARLAISTRGRRGPPSRRARSASSRTWSPSPACTS